MKRSMADDPQISDEIFNNLNNSKKLKFEDEEYEFSENGFAKIDENLLYEVLKHADPRTLAVASCVNKMWHRTAEDERLWELMYTRHSANINCGSERLRSVVLALGGFRRLHSLYLSKTASASSSSAPVITSARVSQSPVVTPAKGGKRWGKDEVHLSLSLLSIRYYEKMHFTGRNTKSK